MSDFEDGHFTTAYATFNEHDSPVRFDRLLTIRGYTVRPREPHFAVPEIGIYWVMVRVEPLYASVTLKVQYELEF